MVEIRGWKLKKGVESKLELKLIEKHSWIQD